jgi:hypothetical protein
MIVHRVPLTSMKNFWDFRVRAAPVDSSSNFSSTQASEKAFAEIVLNENRVRRTEKRRT